MIPVSGKPLTIEKGLGRSVSKTTQTTASSLEKQRMIFGQEIHQASKMD